MPVGEISLAFFLFNLEDENVGRFDSITSFVYNRDKQTKDVGKEKEESRL